MARLDREGNLHFLDFRGERVKHFLKPGGCAGAPKVLEV
jgi:hypothetical protein